MISSDVYSFSYRLAELNANVSTLKVLVCAGLIFLLAAIIMFGYMITEYLRMIARSTSRMNIDMDDLARRVADVIKERYDIDIKH